MTGEIMIFGRAFKLGIAAERERTRALLVEAQALAAELGSEPLICR